MRSSFVQLLIKRLARSLMCRFFSRREIGALEILINLGEQCLISVKSLRLGFVCLAWQLTTTDQDQDLVELAHVLLRNDHRRPRSQPMSAARSTASASATVPTTIGSSTSVIIGAAAKMTRCRI